MARGLVQEITAWGGVNADGVDAERRHQAEVFGNLAQAGKLVPGGVGSECAVCNALDKKAFVARAQKLPIGYDPRQRRRLSHHTNRRVGLKSNAHSTLGRFLLGVPKTQFYQ